MLEYYINMLEYYINKYNTFSNNMIYIYIYYIIGIISFLLSYSSQYLLESPCKNPLAIIIRTIHHLMIFFIYFGFLAPIKDLLLMSILVCGSIISWLYNKNYCIFTILENKLCMLNSNRVFRDSLYYLSNNIDTFLSSIRIYLLSFTFLIILLRLYFYYYSSNKIEIHGHRGSRGNYPENTLSAFKYALDNNINILELDLQLTKDNEIIIYHDKNIDPNICINGPMDAIKKLTLREIKKFDCGSKQNPDFKNQITVPGEHIPTFKELINMVNKDYYFKNIKFNVEIKTDKELDSDDEVLNFAQHLIMIIHNEKLQDQTIVQSFDLRALEYIKQLDPNIKTSYLIIKTTNIDDIFLINAKKLGIEIISPEYDLITKENVDMIHKAGLEVIPWTVNDKATFKKLVEYNVDGIITDYPVEFKDYLYKI